MTFCRNIIHGLLDGGIDKFHRDDQKDHDEDHTPFQRGKRQEQTDDHRDEAEHALQGDAGIAADAADHSAQRIAELCPHDFSFNQFIEDLILKREHHFLIRLFHVIIAKQITTGRA